MNVIPETHSANKIRYLRYL